MKIVSEITGKEYATVKDCAADEKAFLAEQRRQANSEVEEKPVENKNSVTSRKKELAKNIEDADKLLDEAYEMRNNAHKQVKDMYEKTKKELADLVEKQNAEMKAVLAPADEAVKKAEKIKLEAVRQFNEEFGPYKKILTGVEAEKALKCCSMFDGIFDFFNWIF